MTAEAIDKDQILKLVLRHGIYETIQRYCKITLDEFEERSSRYIITATGRMLGLEHKTDTVVKVAKIKHFGRDSEERVRYFFLLSIRPKIESEFYERLRSSIVWREGGHE